MIENRKLKHASEHYRGGRYVPKPLVDEVAIAASALLELRRRESLRHVGKGKRPPDFGPRLIIRVAPNGKIQARVKKPSTYLDGPTAEVIAYLKNLPLQRRRRVLDRLERGLASS